MSGQEGEMSPLDSPLETLTSIPVKTHPPVEPPPTAPPTLTVPPFPTLIPTPIVTPLPTAQPPIIPLPTEPATEPFTIIFPDGNLIRATNSDGTDERTLIDVRSRLPLFLASEKVKIDSWGWASAAPEGGRLALVLSNVDTLESLRKGENPEYDIYLLDLITRELELIVEDGLEPAWSPDGTRIAYRSTQTSGLWVINVSNGEAHEIYPVDQENEHFATDVDWSPDGKRLVFLDKVFRQSCVIMSIDADEAEPALALVPWAGHWLFSPRWSPDGKQILFVSTDGKSSSSKDFYNLWIMNADGTNQTQLTQDISAHRPSWSPDGNWIAFGGPIAYEEPMSLYELWLVSRTGSELKRLTSNDVMEANESAPVWSPDGTKIYFTRNRSEVWMISLVDGSQSKLSSVALNFIIIR